MQINKHDTLSIISPLVKNFHAKANPLPTEIFMPIPLPAIVRLSHTILQFHFPMPHSKAASSMLPYYEIHKLPYLTKWSEKSQVPTE